MIPDECGGSGTIYWSDDSYDSGTFPCPGCKNCKRKEAAVETHGRQEPRLPKSTPNPDEPTITVSIPVTVGGFTGQRDQWEQYTRSHSVKLEGSNVVLHDGAGSYGGRIIFSRHALEAAINVMRDD